jgi:uncharacterized coiled-coil protein SlyX
MSSMDIADILQIGFAALMALLIWRGYERIVSTMVQVVQDNTAALSELKMVITEHTHITERMRVTVETLDKRVSRLEQAEAGSRS